MSMPRYRLKIGHGRFLPYSPHWLITSSHQHLVRRNVTSAADAVALNKRTLAAVRKMEVRIRERIKRQKLLLI
jgi:hypothetical protein